MRTLESEPITEIFEKEDYVDNVRSVKEREEAANQSSQNGHLSISWLQEHDLLIPFIKLFRSDAAALQRALAGEQTEFLTEDLVAALVSNGNSKTTVDNGYELDSEEDTLYEDQRHLLSDEEIEVLFNEVQAAEKSNVAEDDLIGYYLVQLRLYPVLSQEAINELALRVQNGDVDARNEMLFSDLRSVVSVAKQYTGQGVSLLDLIQEGNIILFEKAIPKYDPTRGYMFNTYAYHWLRRVMVRTIASSSRTIRVPEHVHNLIIQISRAEEGFLVENGRLPTLAELSRILGKSQRRISFVKSKGKSTLSLDYPVGDEDAVFGDFVEDRSSPNQQQLLENKLLRREIEKALSTLTPVEERVLRMRYCLNQDPVKMTYEQIAIKLQMSREMIRRIEARALHRLRHPSRSRRLESYYKRGAHPVAIDKQ